MNYYLSKTLEGSYSEIKERTIEALKKEGFGVLTEIDVQATLKSKLDVDFYKYEILGSCNPSFAYQALQAEDKIGTMLPCNVILQQKEPMGPIEVSTINPLVSMQAVKNDKIKPIATEIQLKLSRVLESL